MTPETKRKFNISMGSLFILAGLASSGAGFFAATVPAEKRPAPVSSAPVVDLESCRTALTQMGYSAIMQNKEIRAVEVSLDNPEQQLVKATAAINICRMELQEFCMGEACSQPNTLSFTISAESKRVAKP